VQNYSLTFTKSADIKTVIILLNENAPTFKILLHILRLAYRNG